MDKVFGNTHLDWFNPRVIYIYLYVKSGSPGAPTPCPNGGSEEETVEGFMIITLTSHLALKEKVKSNGASERGSKVIAGLEHFLFLSRDATQSPAHGL